MEWKWLNGRRASRWKPPRLVTAERFLKGLASSPASCASKAEFKAGGWCGAVETSALAVDSTIPSEPVGSEPSGKQMPMDSNGKSLRYLYGEQILPYRNFMERRRTMVA
jgi:hypothetical protein